MAATAVLAAGLPAFSDAGWTVLPALLVGLEARDGVEDLEPHAFRRAQQEVDHLDGIADLIAALNSIEPSVMNVALIDVFYANEEWARLRRPGAVEFVQRRLSALSKSLGDKPYLDGDRFTAGDSDGRRKRPGFPPPGRH